MIKIWNIFLCFGLLSGILFGSEWKGGEYPPFQMIELGGRPTVGNESLVLFQFHSEKECEEWKALNAVSLSFGQNCLHIEATGHDPYFMSPKMEKFQKPEGTFSGDLILRIKMKASVQSGGGFFWGEKGNDTFLPLREQTFKIIPDNQWRDYYVSFHANNDITRFRIDPGNDEGISDIAEIEFLRPILSRIELVSKRFENGTLSLEIKNHDAVPISAEIRIKAQNAKEETKEILSIPDGKGIKYNCKISSDRPFEDFSISIQDIEKKRTLYSEKTVFQPDRKADWISLKGKEIVYQFAPDGSGARILRGDQIVGTIYPLIASEKKSAPLLWDDSIPRILQIAGQEKEKPISIQYVPSPKKDLVEFRFHRGEKAGHIRFTAAPDSGNDLLKFQIKSNFPVHSPILRPQGSMIQAVFPGVEYLEEGEYSSSTADIIPPASLRYAPPVSWITVPLFMINTDRGSFSMICNDPSVQPLFAVPNFIDGNGDEHRMNLFGKNFSGLIRIASPEPIEKTVLWGVKKLGLPPLPRAPRSRKEQDKIILSAFDQSELKTDQGWVHATSPGAKTCPFKPLYGSDFVSTIWEITGKIPSIPRLDYGGGHIRNISSWMIRGEGQKLLQILNSNAAGIRKMQRADGSFGYKGKYLKGHWSDTSSGHCGNSAFTLLSHWRFTGNPDSLAAGCKALEYINRLKTPRGAQVWELSLHTPDIMGSSRCTLANIFAFEATKDQKYLDQARRWALTGLPFVYLHGMNLPGFSDPIMPYASIAVFGATNWRSPNWMGLPVQWCGLDYVYALLLLAPYDQTLDWKKIAEGMILSGECQQYPDGDAIGLLPDSFNLLTQTRRPYNINPSALHLLRRIFEGKPTSGNTVFNDHYHVLSPYKTKIEGDFAIVNAVKGEKYQILVNGSTVKPITSEGIDRIPLK
ncbi:MAG: hypothetical protein Q4G69_09515 [Planctomycetia bacterium]|nr:hypothetical protein [Planctomycetia bacterium]